MSAYVHTTDLIDAFYLFIPIFGVVRLSQVSYELRKHSKILMWVLLHNVIVPFYLFVRVIVVNTAGKYIDFDLS